jgi:hypothetical protein
MRTLRLLYGESDEIRVLPTRGGGHRLPGEALLGAADDVEVRGHPREVVRKLEGSVAWGSLEQLIPERNRRLQERSETAVQSAPGRLCAVLNRSKLRRTALI